MGSFIFNDKLVLLGTCVFYCFSPLYEGKELEKVNIRSNIVWKVDGVIQSEMDITDEKARDKELLKDNFELIKLPKAMNGEILSCEYHSEENDLFLRVFNVRIETSEEICERCWRNMKLVFEESKNSLTGDAVDKSMKKNYDILKVTDIKAKNSAYVVTADVADILKNISILKLNPNIATDKNTRNEDQCQCSNTSLSCGIISAMLGTIAVFTILIVIFTFLWRLDRIGSVNTFFARQGQQEDQTEFN